MFRNMASPLTECPRSEHGLTSSLEESVRSQTGTFGPNRSPRCFTEPLPPPTARLPTCWPHPPGERCALELGHPGFILVRSVIPRTLILLWSSLDLNPPRPTTHMPSPRSVARV